MELNECTFEPWMVERVGMLYSVTQELVLGGIPFSIIYSSATCPFRGKCAKTIEVNSPFVEILKLS